MFLPERFTFFYYLSCHSFYEARPVKHEVCLIGSTFYPSFHEAICLHNIVVSINLYDNAYSLWRARSPIHKPGCCHANQNKLQTSYTLNSLATLKILRRRADEKNKSHQTACRPISIAISHHGRPSRNIAQHLTSNFLATAVIAIFLRDGLPRKRRWYVLRSHEL